MRMDEYLRKRDALSEEERVFAVPQRKEFFLERAGRGCRILDVGCGGGNLGRLLIERNNEVWGVELNSEAALLAAEKGVRVKVEDVERGLPFGPAEFDTVVADGVLDHVYDTRLFFDEAARVLKPGGRLLISASNLNAFENRVRVALGHYPAGVGAYPEDDAGGALRGLNLEKLQELCEGSGFEVEEARGVPWLEPRGRWVDLSGSLLGRLAPGLSRLLLVSARRLAAG